MICSFFSGLGIKGSMKDSRCYDACDWMHATRQNLRGHVGANEISSIGASSLKLVFGTVSMVSSPLAYREVIRRESFKPLPALESLLSQQVGLPSFPLFAIYFCLS